MNIHIRQTGQHTDSDRATFDAEISFDDGERFPITVSDPFSDAQETALEWYFEEWLEFPVLNTVKAERAAQSVTDYGEALFAQVFTGDVYSEYKAAIRYEGGFQRLTISIEGETPFHQLHWESLKDPDHPTPLAVEAPLIRKNRQRAQFAARVQPSPTLNILLVVARPSARDVGYRTISRPLVTALRNSHIRATIDIVRPATFRALSDHLDATRTQHGDGHYHIVHCDMHGELLPQATGGGDVGLLYGDGTARAVLAFDGETVGEADLVSAERVADLLKGHQVPMVVLNACQSAKVERRETEAGQPADETSLASHLMTAGVQWVVGMGYSVTVTAAEKLMSKLYRELLRQPDPTQALRQARRTIWQEKQRKARFNRLIELEDWVLPVVYQNRPVRFRVTEFASVAAENAYWQRQETRYQPPEPTYGFHGRDLDILRLERRLLQGGNVVLVRGMGGAGKTTLLHHLGWWWQTTGFVERVNYFGYDKRAWTLAQLLDALGRDLFGETDYLRGVQPLSAAARRGKIVQKLRAERHLLILDNLESITGTALAIGEKLPQTERDALRDFVATLDGGRSLVLLGSRAAETWLVGRFAKSTYELGGLDGEATTNLAQVILRRYGVSQYSTHADHRTAFQKLLLRLGGFPLALEVVLANLAHSDPATVLDQLEQGDAGLAGEMDAADRTNNLLKCIEVSHGNLSPQAQRLLLVLAPFKQVINVEWLPQYVAQLQRELPTFQKLATLGDVVQEAVKWGLLSPHPDLAKGSGYLQIQPIFPYFLQSRLNDPANQPLQAAIQTAFRAHYNDVSGALRQLIQSKEPQQWQLGQVLTELEYENIYIALQLALNTQASIFNLYGSLTSYLDILQNNQLGLALGQSVLSFIEDNSLAKLNDKLSSELVRVTGDIGNRFLNLKNLQSAQDAYQKVLKLLNNIENFSSSEKAGLQASTLHQLGMVAEEQREWTVAEGYYQQALEIYIAYNDRYEQASTLHQLGNVSYGQREWESAERYYQQALEIYIAYNDRYSQARTLHQLGMVAQAQREWESAERYYQQALEIKIAYNDRYSQADTLGQLGLLKQSTRQWKEAAQYFQRALEIDVEFNNQHRQARTLHNLGRVSQEQREWESAERYYQQALEIYIAYNDRYSQARTLHQLGIVAEAQREWESAERYYQQALEIYIAYNDRYSQGSTINQLGSIAEDQEKWSQAVHYFLQAIQIAVEFNDEYRIGTRMQSLQRVYKATEDATITSRLATLLEVAEAEAVKLLQG